MKYCSRCGKEIEEDAATCIYCGYAMSVTAEQVEPEEQDEPSVGLTVLGFFIPIVGLILYLRYNNDDQPLKAESAGKGALFGFCAAVGLAVLGGLFGRLFFV